MALDLAAETIAYQALLEGHRAYPDDEQIYADLLAARAAMEVAWLERNPVAPLEAKEHPMDLTTVVLVLVGICAAIYIISAVRR
jgi:hypothetical protein